MPETINVENKKQDRKKPPLSVGRIVCEILAGTATGFAVPVPFFYVVYYLVFHVALGVPADWSQKDCGLGGLLVLAIMGLSFPPAYVGGTVVGVYLVGRIGNQTGSLLVTLGGVFLGVPVIALLYLYIDMAGDMMLGIVKIVLWILVFLAPAIGAKLCFNLTRRYKEPPSA